MRDSMTLTMTHEQVSGTELLARLTHELESLITITDRLQDTLSDATCDQTAAWPPLMKELQSLDLLSQRLSALAMVSRRLSGSAPSGWSVDIERLERVVTLSDVTARLSGHAEASPEPAGEFELF